MANSRVFIASARSLLNKCGLIKCYSAITGREYSVYSRNYVEPIFRKEDQESLFQNEEARKIAHEKIKPAMVNDTCSEFYDKRVLKFINTFMRHGDKRLANTLVTKAFEGVKRIQLQRYHKATDEQKENIELDPFVIFHRAVDNCLPVLHLMACRKGGITYQVPVPVTDGRAQHMAMKWLIQAASDKPSEQRFYDVLAKELVAASQNQGRAVQWKQELHKKCQANRAYAHFRWI